MNEQIDHRDFTLFGYFSQNGEIRGYVYYVEVYPKEAVKENSLAFIEKTGMSQTASMLKYGDINANPLEDLKMRTFSKAKARIDLSFFESGREYYQLITSENLNEKLESADDEYIQEHILKGLRNIRKNHPSFYEDEYFEHEGFSEIMKIPLDNYIYNASILVEEEFVKRIDKIEVGGICITSKGIKHLQQVEKEKSKTKPATHTPINTITEEFQYDVAISFAGEDRNHAEQIASKLKDEGIRVFYDEFEQSELWGKNLYEHLSHIYSDAARYCIILLSDNYAKKSWTNHEREFAQARAFREKKEYILPIRIDETRIPGIPETVGYLSIKETPIDKIVEFTIAKLKN